MGVVVVVRAQDARITLCLPPEGRDSEAPDQITFVEIIENSEMAVRQD